MRQLPTATLAVALALALTLGGCGASGGASDPSAHVAKLTLRSPAIHGASIPARYTCDGRDAPPPLEWSAVPPGTGSLVLFVLGVVRRAHGSAISIEWAVAGLNPKLHGLDPRRLPAGAFVGVASDGRRDYSICPRRGTTEQYQFELYGLPPNATVARRFAGLPILAALETRNRSSPTVAYGAFVAKYKRA